MGRQERGFLLKVLTEWADHKPFLADIKLAVKTGQRPTAMIMRDKYAGYRDYDNPNWDWYKAPYVDASEWTDWDFALASAAQFIEDHTNKDNGHLYWVDSSEKVTWEVKSNFSGHDAALESAKERRKPEPGETLYAVPVYDEKDPPTYDEWLDAINNDSIKPYGYTNSGVEEWEILDARQESDRRRAEILDKLRRGEKV